MCFELESWSYREQKDTNGQRQPSLFQKTTLLKSPRPHMKSDIALSVAPACEDPNGGDITKYHDSIFLSVFVCACHIVSNIVAYDGRHLLFGKGCRVASKVSEMTLRQTGIVGQCQCLSLFVIIRRARALLINHPFSTQSWTSSILLPSDRVPSPSSVVASPMHRKPTTRKKPADPIHVCVWSIAI